MSNGNFQEEKLLEYIKSKSKDISKNEKEDILT